MHIQNRKTKKINLTMQIMLALLLGIITGVLLQEDRKLQKIILIRLERYF